MRRVVMNLTMMALIAAWTFGCARPGSGLLPTYQVREENLTQSPPAPMLIAPGDTTSEVVPDSVTIEPEKAIGYENLPEGLATLFEADAQPLSLRDVVVETLAHNRQISIQGYSLKIADWEVPVSKGIYDLLLSATTQYSRTENDASTYNNYKPGEVDTRTRQLTAAVSQLVPSGGVLSLAYGLTRLNALPTMLGLENVSYTQTATLGFDQPLLRGFGPTVTNAPIRIAQLQHQAAAADFQSVLEDQLLSTVSTYWELIGAIEEFKVRVISYSAARDLLRINKAKYDAGVVPQTDVLQAEAAAESRREEVIRARQLVRDIEDELKLAIFLRDGSPQWESQILPTQPFAWREIEVDLGQTIDVAMERRPELRASQSKIDQADLNLKVAKNNVLPDLNLFGDVSTNGLGSGFDEAHREAGSGDYVGYAAGLQFVFPLQNRQARYRYKQAHASLQQATEVKLSTEDSITLQVRQSVRALRTARERIDVTQSQVRSEEAKLASELKRYEVGISTAFQVLEFQEDLANAQSQHLSAVVDYNTAAIAVERARGTLLETYGVQVEGTDLQPELKPVGFPIGLN